MQSACKCPPDAPPMPIKPCAGHVLLLASCFSAISAAACSGRRVLQATVQLHKPPMGTGPRDGNAHTSCLRHEVGRCNDNLQEKAGPCQAGSAAWTVAAPSPHASRICFAECVCPPCPIALMPTSPAQSQPRPSSSVHSGGASSRCGWKPLVCLHARDCRPAYVKCVTEGVAVVRPKVRGRLDVEVWLKAIHKGTHAVSCDCHNKGGYLQSPLEQSQARSCASFSRWVLLVSNAPVAVTPNMRRMGTSVRSVLWSCWLGCPM